MKTFQKLTLMTIALVATSSMIQTGHIACATSSSLASDIYLTRVLAQFGIFGTQSVSKISIPAATSTFAAQSNGWSLMAQSSNYAGDNVVAKYLAKMGSKPVVNNSLAVIPVVANVLVPSSVPVVTREVVIPLVFAGGSSPRFDIATINVRPQSSALLELGKFFNQHATNRNIALAATVAAVATAAGVAYYVWNVRSAAEVVAPVVVAPQVAPIVSEIVEEVTPAVVEVAQVVEDVAPVVVDSIAGAPSTMLSRVMNHPFVSGVKAAGLALVQNVKSIMPTMSVPAQEDLLAQADKIAFAGTSVGTTIAARSIDANLKAEAQKAAEQEAQQ